MLRTNLTEPTLLEIRTFPVSGLPGTNWELLVYFLFWSHEDYGEARTEYPDVRLWGDLRAMSGSLDGATCDEQPLALVPNIRMHWRACRVCVPRHDRSLARQPDDAAHLLAIFYRGHC
jgi:hypothetical protein